MPIIRISAFEGCGYFNAAKMHLSSYKQKHADVDVIEYSVNRPHWGKIIALYSKHYTVPHKTSPLIFYDHTYIGGHDKLLEMLKV